MYRLEARPQSGGEFDRTRITTRSAGTGSIKSVSPPSAVVTGIRLSDLPDGWTVWSDGEDGRVVLAYRPDVFDSDAYPAPCLPTLYVTRGPRERRRPPDDDRRLRDDWHVTLYLEPDVSAPSRAHERRDDALVEAVEWAREFARGDVDYRDLYQVPRERYLARLDELTGHDRSAVG
jgi:hypothetical protein